MAKRKASEISDSEFDLLIQSLPKRDDYTVEYYMEPGNPAVNLVQADRSYVAQVMAYYAKRSKRDPCPAIATVTAALDPDCVGYSSNKSAVDPICVIFKTVKHFVAACNYFQATRAHHHEIVVFVRVDGSPYFRIA